MRDGNERGREWKEGKLGQVRLTERVIRWALKEAAWKASRPYVSSWQDCAVHHDRTGAPVLVVDGDKVPLGFACSVSHDGAYCVAYVVTTTRPGPDEPISLKDVSLPLHH